MAKNTIQNSLRDAIQGLTNYQLAIFKAELKLRLVEAIRAAELKAQEKAAGNINVPGNMNVPGNQKKSENVRKTNAEKNQDN